MARAVIHKLAARSHGRQSMPATYDFLVERVIVECIRRRVSPGRIGCHKPIAQRLDVIELVREQGQRAAVGIGRRRRAVLRLEIIIGIVDRVAAPFDAGADLIEAGFGSAQVDC